MKMRYERWMSHLTTPLGLGPKSSLVELDHSHLRVKMGWAFDANIPLTSITSAQPSTDRVLGWGVHVDTGGRWLVNGSSAGLVDLSVDPAVRARALGLPIKLKRLLVSVDDPDTLIAACSKR